jgi:hypothetical protein
LIHSQRQPARIKNHIRNEIQSRGDMLPVRVPSPGYWSSMRVFCPKLQTCSTSRLNEARGVVDGHVDKVMTSFQRFDDSASILAGVARAVVLAGKVAFENRSQNSDRLRYCCSGCDILNDLGGVLRPLLRVVRRLNQLTQRRQLMLYGSRRHILSRHMIVEIRKRIQIVRGRCRARREFFQRIYQLLVPLR